jgi:hypothetical protein
VSISRHGAVRNTAGTCAANRQSIVCENRIARGRRASIPTVGKRRDLSGPHGSLEIRGYAADPSARIPVVAVFAVVDGGARTYRATYGADGARRAPAGDLTNLELPATMSSFPQPIFRREHTIALRAVPRKLDGYYGVGVPLHLMSR